MSDSDASARVATAQREVREALSALADVDAAATESDRWAEATFVTVRPLLAEQARRAYRRRVAAALAAAFVPLPLIVAYDRVLLEWMYTVASLVLPEPLPAVAVAGYAGAVVLLLASTYAAIPVLVETSINSGRQSR